MAIVVTVEGIDYNLDRLTLAEAAKLEERLGRDWFTLNPARDARTCIEVFVVLLTRTHPEAEARRIAEGLTIEEALDACRRDETESVPTEWEDGLPKVEANSTS